MTRTTEGGEATLADGKASSRPPLVIDKALTPEQKVPPLVPA